MSVQGARTSMMLLAVSIAMSLATVNGLDAADEVGYFPS